MHNNHTAPRNNGECGRPLALCRGEGVGYIALSLGDAGRTLEGLHAHVRVATLGESLPAYLTPFRTPWQLAAWGLSASAAEERGLCVAVLPLLAKDMTLEVEDATGRGLAHAAFDSLSSKLHSRLLTRCRPKQADALRRTRIDVPGAPRLWVSDIFCGMPGTRVWRLQATLPTADGRSRPELKLYGLNGQPMDARTIMLEDHVVPSKEDHVLSERVISLSAVLPQDVEQLLFVISLSEGPTTGMSVAEDHHPIEAFCCMLPFMTRRIYDASCGRMLDAGKDPAYEDWFFAQRVSAEILARQRRCFAKLVCDGEAPLVSVLATHPDDVLPSLKQQSYALWELVRGRGGDGAGSFDKTGALALARAAKGELCLVIEGPYRLEPDALWRLVSAIKRDPSLDLTYADEDESHEGRLCHPHFKCFPNLGHLRAISYIGGVLLVRTSVLKRLLQTDPPADGTCDHSCRFDDGTLGYSLALRAFEVKAGVGQVTKLLSHRIGASCSHQDEKRRALRSHLSRCCVAADIEPGPVPGSFRLRYRMPQDPPPVSIIIPSKDKADLLRTCVESILQHTTYPTLEIVVVENNSSEAATFELYDVLHERDPRVNIVTWTPSMLKVGRASSADVGDGGFNYSSLVNFGASQATGQYLIMLNNDTQVIEGRWIEEMLGVALYRSEVAVVGAKLLFGDELIQHAGMIANPAHDNAHINQSLYRDDPGYDGTAVLPSDMNMVTGACQLIPRRIFDSLGGYDENLAVGFNDSEFCLRARAHDLIVSYTPYALLYHREFSTRGREALDERLQQRLLVEKSYILSKYPEYYAHGDDLVNANLDRFSNYYHLRW